MASPLNSSSSAVDIELFQACKKGDNAAIKKFIREGRSFNVIDSDGTTPLMHAAACKSEVVFTKVLAQTSEEFLHKVNKQGQNILFYACSTGSLSRVKLLYEEKAVKVILSSKGKFPAQMTSNQEIEKLLHSEAQLIINTHKSILEDAQRKHGNNLQALDQEVYERTGQRIALINNQRDNYGPYTLPNEIKDMKGFRQSILEHPRTQRDIRENLTEYVPNSTRAASKQIQQISGVILPKEQTQELLKQVGVTPKKDLLNDKNVRREIGSHFKKNKPKSVQEAIDYIYEKYQFTCQPKHIIPFLAYFGITSEPSPKVEPSDVD